MRSAAYCEAVRGTLLGGVGDVCLRRRNIINCWDIFANLTDSSFQKVSVKISNYLVESLHRCHRLCKQINTSCISMVPTV